MEISIKPSIDVLRKVSPHTLKDLKSKFPQFSEELTSARGEVLDGRASQSDDELMVYLDLTFAVLEAAVKQGSELHTKYKNDIRKTGRFKLASKILAAVTSTSLVATAFSDVDGKETLLIVESLIAFSVALLDVLSDHIRLTKSNTDIVAGSEELTELLTKVPFLKRDYQYYTADTVNISSHRESIEQLMKDVNIVAEKLNRQLNR